MQVTVSLSTTDTNIAAGDYWAYVVWTETGVYETLLQSKWKVVE